MSRFNSGSTFTPLSSSFAFTPLTVTSPSCTWSTSYSGSNVQYGVGSAVGLAFQEIEKANKNWTTSRDLSLSTGNHWGLPSGTHSVGTTKIIKGDGYIRYEPEHGHCTVVSDDGKISSYMK